MWAEAVRDGLFISSFMFFAGRIGAFGSDTWRIKTTQPTDQYQFQNNNYFFCSRIMFQTPSERQVQWAYRPVDVFVNDKRIQ